MNNDKSSVIVDHIKQKINDAHLRPEEIQAIDKARNQVFTRSTVGTLVFGRRRRISVFLMIPFVSGGFLFGSQLGMLSGIMAGKRTIEKLPDQARLINLVKEIQKEVMEANGYVRDSSSDIFARPRPMTPEEKQEYKQKTLLDNDANNNNDPSDWWSSTDDDDNMFMNDNNNDNDTWLTNDQVPSNTTATTWDRIRQQNMSK
ncbi:uncharacterized protein BX663DRAFT_273945 [Cokeromyces recurvatus]|uniref:uncharacterized protein n=1 Tax=Cokeromyces recurvatus TaxID=90255 RepID=UPI00221E5B64|nr:uncharacterized protein BX663DRAFT_273945 [Cokeromyces recurvatus]KAI7898034.1 hypothetical protein BX663DRAFT_273945 [Cokeromyces recurvatus]